MNNTLKLALGAVLTAGLILPALAQDNFPDVPDNHWAYEALARLKKDGLLVGYPDGLFRGNRPASRYELAVAINATYVHLKSITDGLQSEIDDLKNGMKPSDMSAINSAIQQLQDEVNNMKGWGDDIDNLKKLADQFQKELASLGVDVEGLKRDLADLAKRVGVLEAHRLPIDIHGDANLFMIGGASDDHKPGISVIGRPVGVRIPYTSGPAAGAYDMAGLDVDSTVYHELDLKLTSNNDTGPKWRSDLVVGDMFGDNFSGTSGAFPSMSGTTTSSPLGGRAAMPFGVGVESVYVQDLAVDFDTSIVNQGLKVELGRTGYSIDPYIFQRPNPNPYFSNDRWDNGKWYFDGGILGFHFGGVMLDAWAGKQSDATTTQGLGYTPMTVGFMGHPYTPGSGMRPVGLSGNSPGLGLVNGGNGLAGISVDTQLGVNLRVPITNNGKLDLSYLWFESNNGEAADGTNPIDAGSNANNNPSNAIANRADVYGGDLKWNFGNIMFKGGYSASDLRMGNTNLTSKDNYEWHGQLGYDASNWGVEAGYRQIEPQFGAPGDWGRIGIWWNPTDIEGPQASAHINLSSTIKLSASGEWDQGTGSNYATPSLAGSSNTGLSTHDRLDHYTADLGVRLNDAWNLSLGTELVYWHLPEAAAGTTNPTEMWYNLGLGYNLSEQARLSFLYQFSNYDSKGNGDFQVFNPAYAGSKYTGSLLTTQLTVKF